ncbi:MAG: PhoX family phosphatase [Pseudorhodoplanes sp.]
MSQANLTRAQAFERSEDVGRNDSQNPSLGDVIATRFHRRDIIRGALGAVAIGATVSPLAIAAAANARADTARYEFKEVAAGVDENHHVADGYDADVLMRWGDPVLLDAPAFNPLAQDAAAQKKQFGYNNDFLGYIPIPGAANPSHHGLLVVNHEYTNEELMFPGLGRQDARDAGFSKMTKPLVDIEMAAHGGSVVEIRRESGKWRIVGNSRYARRITADTPMDITGPAAGHDRMKTAADPEGRTVLGMVNNCAGGVTPWGTWLTCEENFHGYFWGKLADGHPETRNYKRYGVPTHNYAWGKFNERFDVSKEPNEPNRFGWIVEIDPFDPGSTPKKRTALGRFKHEGAYLVISKDGRAVVYSGDDERFDYVYKFVSANAYNPNDRAANRDLLDHGTLYVARYNADGSADWLALTHGQGPLTAANGFHSQADIAIETRRAADLLGATRMDRPEDVEVNPRTNKVYVVLTNNTRRKADQIDPANPRADNRFGHIIEMTPPNGDHAATKARWEILLKCGDPSIAEVGASFNAATTKDGWFGMPDNCAVDHMGRLWIATDGNSAAKTGRADGIWRLETEGENRATGKLFFRCPAGAEMCGPEFTPDDETFFVAVQHPGEADEDDPKAAPATFENPATRWPDFDSRIPPRPSVVAITKRDGGKIGT